VILDQILATKRDELVALQAREPLAALRRRAEAAPPPRGFLERLAGRSPGAPAAAPAAQGRPLRVIAEVKKASPSKGLIRPDFDPVAIARAYAAAGAACISVLTDTPYFQGRLEYLAAIRAVVPQVPLLRKDFVIDPYQLYEARAAGADAVLLIVAVLAPPQLTELHALATALGLDALVEVHTAAELETALRLQPQLIGINNRDLRTFHTTLDVTRELAPRVPADVLLVSESGIGTRADLAVLAAAGARAVLVGESLMCQPDVAAALRALQGVA